MPRTILIIDDDRELCDLVGELLRGEGFEVDAHHTGAGAVDLAASGYENQGMVMLLKKSEKGKECLVGAEQSGIEGASGFEKR